MPDKKLTRLASTKNELAEKYDRLAKLACSVPKRLKFRRKAATFRHQARMLEIEVGR